jgi:hypothetical protein
MYRIMVVIQICGLIFGVFVYLRDQRNRTSKTGS